MAAAYSSHDIVEDYLHYKLLSRGVAWPRPPPDPGLAPPPLQAALRTAGDELARCYHGDLWAQVSVQRRSLEAVNRQLFRDGVNWGRIIAMMELGGALSTEAAEAGHTWQVDDIAGWMEDSLDSPPLRGWIQDNGGWDAFLQLYESRPPAASWSLRSVVGLVVLGAAGITLGVWFSHT